jgi:hypothetical protein
MLTVFCLLFLLSTHYDFSLFFFLLRPFSKINSTDGERYAANVVDKLGVSTISRNTAWPSMSVESFPSPATHDILNYH